jgi:aminocarboxymuconate-semialdehyde decarboxylase
MSSMLETIEQVAALPHLKGVIMGSAGLGKGLDDPVLEEVWEALARTQLVVFLHPHYGVDSKAWGDGIVQSAMHGC